MGLFPGVGHASSAMDSLAEQQLISYLQKTTKPLLGICVGMQLLFDKSDEATPNGNPTQALGCLSGCLERFETGGNKEYKVPHMGWNQIKYPKKHPLLNGIPSGSIFYFVHSYFAPITPWTLATCDYIQEFSAVVERDNYLGVQFHPEKVVRLELSYYKTLQNRTEPNMHVIPAIDLLNGDCVRLHKGDYDQATVYNKDPLSQSKTFADGGFSHIHVVDLNGAKHGEFINLKHIQEMIHQLGLSVQAGGGIRHFEDAKKLLDAGLSKVICSSMAIKNEADWMQLVREYPQHSVLGLDLKNGQMAFSGWLERASEAPESMLERMQKEGLQEVLCTDISKDGTLSGTNLDLYVQLKNTFPDLRWIASGGVSGVSDLEALHHAGIDAVVVGKAYYEGILNLEKMAYWNSI